ncbi:aspartate--tRNA ligase [Sulfoacidibacillus thermotolerans]|uniref:Aspartate--tRNA ligase n=1 Tax=Sulfoacidibacillus thermotolerans TaxID=1765684 RepID=A0A2U3D8Z6_SULT2|nr:aspartate--tRNA ligase [Sulfoacidibacillus thermotolerans]PWI57748.1 aspartate--tRNA ligase [Sulfoacidibacillus thermotolerans]
MEFRTHFCNELRKEHVNKQVFLSGWVQRRRDLGGVIFVDLRDRTGIVQLVFRSDIDSEALQLADRLRNEYVIRVEGKVVIRDLEAVNPKLETGEIEVEVQRLHILNAAKNPPFQIEEDVEVDESLRLRYRYLDLRRANMFNTFMMRHRVYQVIRTFLDRYGFLEVETPMLTKSTPEGARDYLVPSRVHPGEFYALPQSPQLFKQLLMVSGFERYFQIVRCFRDEDLRADRQPEFTQLDIETSFLSMEQLQEMMEEMIVEIFSRVLQVHVARPFLRLTYQEAMERFGSDKPDLRFGMELIDLSQELAACGFKVFREALQKGGQVKALVAPGCGGFSRKELDDLTKFVARYKAKGLAWMIVAEEGIRSPIAKFFTEEELQSIVTATAANIGDLILFVADKKKIVADALGALRLHLGKLIGAIDEQAYAFAWITEFPLLEYDEDEHRYVAVHHPFTMPMVEDLEYLESNPGAVRAQAYDMVLNGYEIGGGSMRIYQREVQERMFASLGFTEEAARAQFGFLLDAFDYGTPPHGGIAFGMDRLMMVMSGQSSLRDVIAFPKTASGTDLLTGAPAPVAQEQLEILHLATKGIAE